MTNSCEDEVIGVKQGASKRPEYVRRQTGAFIGVCLLPSAVTASELSNLSTSCESFSSSTFIYFHGSLLVEHIHSGTSHGGVLSKFRVTCGGLCVFTPSVSFSSCSEGRDVFPRQRSVGLLTREPC